MRLAILLATAATASAGGIDSEDLLARIKARVLETTTRLPNYLCTETIDRTQYEPHGLRVRSCEALVSMGGWSRRKSTSDRLRLDVAVGSKMEMYSWVGENRFDDRSLIELVGSGPVSTGSFASFLMTIFGGHAATFSYKGEKSLKGRRVVEFAFEVPLERSQYQVYTPKHHLTKTAYGGEFYADAGTFDLVRLLVQTRGLRPESGACQDTTTLDYTRVRLNGADFLLPAEATFHIIFPEGIETENRTVFSACHEFRGESKLSFDTAPEPVLGSDRAPANRIIVLPPDVTFSVAFSADIAVATAAAGDRIPCRIVDAIRDASSETAVPAGTALTCRLIRVQHFDLPVPSLTLAFELQNLTVRGLPVRLAAVANTEGHGVAGALLNIHRANEGTNMAVVEFSKARRDQTIKSGFKTTWLTLPPP